MSRPEIIFELARYAHPSIYHALLNKNTATLKALLTFYKEGGDHKTVLQWITSDWQHAGGGGGFIFIKTKPIVLHTTLPPVDYTRSDAGDAKQHVWPFSRLMKKSDENTK